MNTDSKFEQEQAEGADAVNKKMYYITSSAGWVLDHIRPTGEEWVRLYQKAGALKFTAREGAETLDRLKKTYGNQIQLTAVDE